MLFSAFDVFLLKIGINNGASFSIIHNNISININFILFASLCCYLFSFFAIGCYVKVNTKPFIFHFCCLTYIWGFRSN